MIAKKFSTGRLFLAMFPVCMAFMPAASAEETANVVETAKGTPGYDGSATVYN